ncbi:MAG: GNAT family N-acetyltransferase [Betaproteobacteria bacterium]|nr:GNAT family N-acetyltransferase [Betaproteobacteria bacterium]
MAEYPHYLVQHRALFDGTPVTIRPIRQDDSGMEQEFVRHLSDDSRYNRFMGMLRELPPNKLKRFTEIDYDQHMAFIATIAPDGNEIEIGVARYVATEKPGSCEFAIVVDDAWQRTGVAGLLMLALQQAARERGFSTMEGLVLASNRKMLRFCRQLGFRVHREPGEGDTVHVDMQL